MGFLEGLRTGKEIGGRNPFNVVLESINKADEKRRKDEAKEAEQSREFRDKILLEGTKAKIQEIIEKTQAEAKAKREAEATKQKQKFELAKGMQLERIKGEETRKTERVKAQPTSLLSLIQQLREPLPGQATEEQIIERTEPLGETGRRLRFARRGTTEEQVEQFRREGEPEKPVRVGDVLGAIGLKPKLTGGKVGAEAMKSEAFKPFQLTPEREQEFKISIQNGLNALQRGEENPATGQPYTAQEIFRTLSAAFPGQTNRLRTMFLSGVRMGETEDFGNILFGE